MLEKIPQTKSSTTKGQVDQISQNASELIPPVPLADPKQNQTKIKNYKKENMFERKVLLT